MMKDGLLRDNTSNNSSIGRKPSTRQIRSRIRASLFFSDDNEGGPGSNPTDDTQRGGAPASSSRASLEDGAVGGDEDLYRTRSRSMSDTLGDFFFRPKRERQKEGGLATDLDDAEDEAHGGNDHDP
jgi:hypothetical protein